MVRGAKEELLRSNTPKVTKLEGKNGGAAPELLWSSSTAAPEQLLFGSSVYQFQKVSIHVNEQKFKETQNNNLWTVKS